jgi:transposase InsO family protein
LSWCFFFKRDTAARFRDLVLHAEILTGLSITSVRLDCGGKYLGQELLQFFTSKGISYQYSVPHLPQQNGRAERFNQTIMKKAQAIRFNACLPNSF